MATVYPTVDELKQKAIDLFKKEFNECPTHAAVAPGRVNLIGEHVDYCDGFVLPMALPLVTIVVGSKACGTEATIVTDAESVDEPHKATLTVTGCGAGQVYTVGEPKWLNYVKGIIVKYEGKVPAFNAVIVSSVPVGGGLSSSAALELSVYTFLDAIAGPNNVSPTDRAIACMEAEHEYGLVPCGIMDQLVGALGQAGHALLIDCRDKSVVPIPLEDKVILITNSNVKHNLSGSEYPLRRQQCEKAAELLNLKSLRDATESDVQKLEKLGAEKDVIKRARHVIGEIKRTQEAAEALKQNDFKKFGKLMIESHNSLRSDFEVSCPELDEIVESSLTGCGGYGTRMTGGGFGGCTVTLAKEKCVNKLIDLIKKGYKGNPTFYVCKPSDGARILPLD